MSIPIFGANSVNNLLSIFYLKTSSLRGCFADQSLILNVLNAGRDTEATLRLQANRLRRLSSSYVGLL